LIPVLLGLLAASQVFYMSLEESLDFTETILLARVSCVIHLPMDYLDRMEYYFEVLDVVSGPDSLEGEFIATYESLFPRSYYDEEGNEIWESPIVTGSGLEMFIEEGDSVIMFLERVPDDPQQFTWIVRIEPADSLDSILFLLDPEE